MAKLESDKVMYEIYREADYDRRFRVVYFTELSERNRDHEIASALAGEHICDGFLSVARLSDAKLAITALLDRLNAGEALPPAAVAAALAAYRT